MCSVFFSGMSEDELRHSRGEQAQEYFPMVWMLLTEAL